MPVYSGFFIELIAASFGLSDFRTFRLEKN
jgi:hypothetical protein